MLSKIILLSIWCIYASVDQVNGGERRKGILLKMWHEITRFRLQSCFFSAKYVLLKGLQW